MSMGDLSGEDVGKFIMRSEISNHVWHTITMHGGEPTLNDDVIAIGKLLVDYRARTKGCERIWIVTNGSQPDVTDRLKEMGIDIGLSVKKGSNIDHAGNPIPYVPVNESPTDLGEPWLPGCFQMSECGICYNYLGFWPCSPMAAAARVFGYQPYCHDPAELNPSGLYEYAQQHCRHCGFAMPGRSRVIEQTTTATWEKALADYGSRNR